MKNGFKGWYFKHQSGDDSVCFIPGTAKSGAFVQVITGKGSAQYAVPDLTVNGSEIKAGNCTFSLHGCSVELPGISGKLSYDNITPLRSDIMGPFRFLPMQCRHGIISMHHTLDGKIVINGKTHDFGGGIGYIESDSGVSFPRSYLWLQCNDFEKTCAITVSVAHIPFGCISFKGCICAIIYEGREFRLATYCGVRINTLKRDRICLTQGNLRLEINISPSGEGFELRSPVSGNMSGIIRESSNAHIGVKLWESNNKIIDLQSDRAMYEFVP